MLFNNYITTRIEYALNIVSVDGAREIRYTQFATYILFKSDVYESLEDEHFRASHFWVLVFYD